jgi:hypothetical protein
MPEVSQLKPPAMRRTWWKTYFVVILALTVLGLASRFLVQDARQLPWWEWLLIPLFIIQIVGLFGFAYWRRLGIPVLWRVVFLASVANEVWDLVSITTDPDLKDDTFFVGATLFLQIPMLIGLFLYAFRCKELWHRAT